MSTTKKPKRNSRSNAAVLRKTASSRSRPSRSTTLRPVKRTGRRLVAEERDEGPSGWFLPTIEAAYTRLAPRTPDPSKYPRARKAPGRGFASRLQSGRDESVLASINQAGWTELLHEYKQRKAVPKPPAPVPATAAPAAP